MRKLLVLAVIVAVSGCRRPEAPTTAPRPSILLVTLDTTRADAIGPEAIGVETPAFNKLAAQGRRFRYAYTAVPQTLPSHISMMTGLYPPGHGVHENSRTFVADQPLIAQKLRDAGYRTAAFVSAFALARRFGLAHGFDVYDEEFGSAEAERQASQTTDRAIAYLQQPSSRALFLWVHYYDPHFPYAPAEPYRSRYARQPYLGEVAAMDEQLGRLVEAFRKTAPGPVDLIVVGDHGEGLGEHGEEQHGNLMYQATMHVPLLMVGRGVTAGTSDAPVSTRRVFHTILDWAGIDAKNSLARGDQEVVMAEAMKPFLDYGWQPQVMAVEGPLKTISSGQIEVYDVMKDPGEEHNLASGANISRPVRAALRTYPIPSAEKAAHSASAMTDEEKRQLASLGYVSADVRPVVRKDAPRPVQMTRLFPILDKAAGLFVREQYEKAIPLLERILADDPFNLDAALRLATSHSSLGHERQAQAAFEKARQIAPNSPDVQTFLALHLARGKDWERSVPLLEKIVAESPDRVPALEALALVRQHQGRLEDALTLLLRIEKLRTPAASEQIQMGRLAMQINRTDEAIDAFEKARRSQGAAFRNDLELGVLYLASNRFNEARDALDRVPSSHPGYAMALFKRAQVSVLLRESDSSTRIATARRHADATTRQLIERERLFR